MRTVVVDAIAPEGLAWLRERSFQLTQLMKPSPEELRAALADCEALGREGAQIARALPPGRQRDMYQWRQHLAFVLGEARERLQRLPSDAR